MDFENKDPKRKDSKKPEDAIEVSAAANKAKSWFLATMSHEIRTPLNAIMGMAELLGSSPLTPEQASFVATIKNNSEALLDLISEILEFSRIEAHKIKFEEQEFFPMDVVSEAVESVAALAESKKLSLYSNFTCSLTQSLIWDPRRLRQVIVNLLSNAVKFTQIGGVTVRTSLVDDSTPGRAWLTISVKDTGVGIQEFEKESLFVRFGRSRIDDGGRPQGTGLGLSIIKILVEQAGGRIDVASRAGEGSTFTVAIPVQKAFQYGEVHDFDPVILEKKTILLIDEDPQSREITERILSQFGAHFISATNAQEALLHLEHAASVDLILLTEGSLSWEATSLRRVLNQFAVQHRVPVILMSPLRSIQGRAPSSVPNAERISNPVTPQKIARSLRRALCPEKTDGESSVVVNVSLPKNMKILLAEDDRDNQKYMIRVLENAGFAVDLAPDGGIALEKAKLQSYDLIVTDLLMPVLDGIQFVEKFRDWEQAGHHKATPIIAVSAHAVPEVQQRCASVGINAFLAKPVYSEQLIQEICRFSPDLPLVISVEDDPDQRTILEHYLKDAKSFRLDLLGNPMDVIKAVLERKPRLLLLDMNLPGVSGYDIARELRARPSTRDLPIIAVTAEDGEFTRQECLEAGCSDVVTKPVHREKLLALIESSLHADHDAREKESGAGSFDRPSIGAQLADLVPAYLERRMEDVSKIRASVEDEDFEEIARIAHCFKGSGASYGFAFLSQLGADLEDAAKKGSAVRIMKSVEILNSYLNRIQTNPQPSSHEIVFPHS